MLTSCPSGKKTARSIKILAVILWIQMTHKILVAVVQLGGNPLVGVQKDLGRLTPTRMIEPRIGIGPKPIFVRGVAPEGPGTAFGELDENDRFDAFEPILPGHHHSDRRTTLSVERMPINAKRQQRQLIHRLLHAKSFVIRP